MKIGYCANIPFSPAESQEEGLKAAGVDKVYMLGRGGENLTECLRAMRVEKTIHVFGGLRVFGGSRDAIVKTVKDLKPIVIVDEMNKERSDQDGAAMLDRAMRQILGANKVRGSSKFARKIASQGGRAKGDAAEWTRKGIAEEFVIRNVVNCEMLTWDAKVAIFDGKISEATMRRHYYYGK